MLNHPALSAGIMVGVSVLYNQRCKALDTTQKSLLTKYVPSENYIRPIGNICEQPLFLFLEQYLFYENNYSHFIH